VGSTWSQQTNPGHDPEERDAMPDHVYNITEIVGSSTEGVDAAIKVGIDRAASTLRGLDWFEVTEIRGHLVDGQIAHYQVGLKVGFRLEDTQ
jgi:flavin-binding protein dodecin